MAPGYRNSNRRQNRTGYVDHDVFEGLPVRHWRRDFVTVAPPPTQENTTSQNDIWAVELPHGMPKDSHLLSQHSQDLLRAARSGRIYKRPPPVEEEEADPETILGDKPEKKEDDARDKGFTAKAWKQIPRHMEGPDVEYLAKRRKGLITKASKAVATGPTLTKTTVRRTDAAGNEYVQDVIVPKGQPVEGEVISQTVIPDPAAAEGFAHPTPPKRKGAPPKNKKLKGPGRGRKKKQIAPTSVPESISVDGLTQSVEGGAEGAAGQDGVKIENTGNENGVAAPTPNEDTEMAEGSMAASDDEGGEEGEDGEEGDDDEGSVSAQDSPSKPTRPFSPVVSELPHMREIPNFGSLDTDMSGIDLPGPPLPKLDTFEGKSGSPLKNVVLTTSNLTSPIKSPEATQDPFTENATVQQPVEEASNIPELVEATTLDKEMQQEAAETAPPILPPPPPEPTIAEVISSTEVRQEEEEEEEMLLDIVENTNNANIGAPQDPIPTVPEVLAEPTALPQEPEVSISLSEPEPDQIPEPQPEEEQTLAPAEPSPQEEVAEQPVEDDDDFNDLLGGLEKQLNEPQATSPAPEPMPEIVEAPVEPEKAISPVAEIAEVTEVSEVAKVAEAFSEEKVEEVKEVAESA